MFSSKILETLPSNEKQFHINRIESQKTKEVLLG